MEFTELNFFIFCSVVILGHIVCSKKQNYRLLWLNLVSIYFLMTWSWQSAALVFVNSFFIFTTAQLIQKHDRQLFKTVLAYMAVSSQVLAMIFVRKFFNNEISTYDETISQTVFFVGLSYYGLQNISFIVESFRNNQKEPGTFWNYLFYSIYFPKVLVGPIEQYDEFTRRFKVDIKKSNHAYSAYLIVLGLFKKLVLSGNLIELCYRLNISYGHERPFFISWLLGAFMFMVLYCDFSAYINIGRGISLLLGLELMENFDRPYLAKGPIDYWHRWHISMGNWMRTYVYYPVLLKFKKVNFAVFLTFLAVALWHGLNLGLLWWAIGCGVFQLFYILLKRNLHISSKLPSKMTDALSIIITFNINTVFCVYTFLPMLNKKITKAPINIYLSDIIGLLVSMFFCLILLFGIESIQKRKSSKWFYLVTSLILTFITASLMTSKSYTFYYLRI